MFKRVTLVEFEFVMTNVMKKRCRDASSHEALMVRVSERWVDFKVALRSVIFMVPDHAATAEQMLADRHEHLSRRSVSDAGRSVSQRVSVTGQGGPQQTSVKLKSSYLHRCL